ncbi:MAG TPA: hypothetical protein VFZ74_18370 [Burkholderiales bacterium]
MRTGAGAATDCPIAAPSRGMVHARAMHRACVVVGGVAALAAKLKASEAAVRSWIEGIDEPPESAFLGAVEILLLHAEQGTGTAS